MQEEGVISRGYFDPVGEATKAHPSHRKSWTHGALAPDTPTATAMLLADSWLALACHFRRWAGGSEKKTFFLQ